MKNKIDLNKFRTIVNEDLTTIFTKLHVEQIELVIEKALKFSVEIPIELPTITVQQFIDACCIQWDTPFEKIVKNRGRNYIYKKYALIYFLRHNYKLTLSEIKIIFQKHHTTIMYALNLANDFLSINDERFSYFFQTPKNII